MYHLKYIKGKNFKHRKGVRYMKKQIIMKVFRYGGLLLAIGGAVLWYAHLIPKSVQLGTFVVGILCFIIGSAGLKK